MAVALLSYFSTMVTAFAALMFLLTSVFSSTSIHHTRPAPPRMSAMARTMAFERTASIAAKQSDLAKAEVTASSAPSVHQASSSDTVNEGRTRVASAKQTQKAKALRLARDERRKERLAGRRQDTGYSTTALGYAAESPTRVAAERVFSTIRARR
jgi:hypothetical protein